MNSVQQTSEHVEEKDLQLNPEGKGAGFRYYICFQNMKEQRNKIPHIPTCERARKDIFV